MAAPPQNEAGGDEKQLFCCFFFNWPNIVVFIFFLTPCVLDPQELALAVVASPPVFLRVQVWYFLV